MNAQIGIDSPICHGKLTIRGMGMVASLISSGLASGIAFEEFEREYSLTRAYIRYIRAAFKFAGELVDQEEHHPLGAIA